MGELKGYALTKIVFQRGLALMYLIAFLVAVNQFVPLLGENGLLPVPLFLERANFGFLPSIFRIFPTDAAFVFGAWFGVILSSLALTGVSERFGSIVSIIIWGALWFLYLSFVNVGQIFYGFGWESILLEAGFFAVFLGGAGSHPSSFVIWILRWLLFRIMFGAGLIKLRGDDCWRDLTCLFYHYETQPIPNALSWFFHWLPKFVHRAGVLFNHFVEVIVPFFYFAPQPFAAIAGIITIVFQGMLLVSGNFAWLSMLTIVLAISTLNDKMLSAVLRIAPPKAKPTPELLLAAGLMLAIVVGIMSIAPITNMLSPRQAMNVSYNPLHLVGTYGAFGTITRSRYEVIVEGTRDTEITDSTKWEAYEFKGKPGDPRRAPPQIAPYHLRLDWLMWFAAFSSYEQHPWFVNFMAKLLQGDAKTLALLRHNPFPDAPPAHVRAFLYEYRFSTPDERKETGQWWIREFEREYFPVVSLQDPAFRQILIDQGWMSD